MGEDRAGLKKGFQHKGLAKTWSWPFLLHELCVCVFYSLQKTRLHKMLWLYKEQVTGHSCLFNMLLFIPLIYLDHLLAEFACTGSLSEDGESFSFLELSAPGRGARVSACTAVAGWLPAEFYLSRSPSVLKKPLRMCSLNIGFPCLFSWCLSCPFWHSLVDEPKIILCSSLDLLVFPAIETSGKNTAHPVRDFSWKGKLTLNGPNWEIKCI